MTSVKLHAYSPYNGTDTLEEALTGSLYFLAEFDADPSSYTAIMDTIEAANKTANMIVHGATLKFALERDGSYYSTDVTPIERVLAMTPDTLPVIDTPANANESLQEGTQNGTLWVYFQKLYGWTYVYVPRDGSMPSTDTGYSDMESARVEGMEVVRYREKSNE